VTELIEEHYLNMTVNHIFFVSDTNMYEAF